MCAHAALMLFTSWVTEILGVDSIFGAFITGVITPRSGNNHTVISHSIEPLTLAVFLPLYFTLSGIRTQFSSLSTGASWGVVILVIVASFAGKLGGCAVAARMMGLPWKDSVVIGSLMNARGYVLLCIAPQDRPSRHPCRLVGLIVLNIGLTNGVVSQSSFTCS